MKNRSVLVLLAAAVVGAVALTAFYRGDRLSSPAPGTARKVIVIFKTIDYHTTPFWGNVRDGVVSAGEDFGVTPSIRGPAVESDVQGQIDIVRKAIEEKPDAIVLAAADYNLLVPAAKEIKRHGIPLVCMDSFINSDDDDVRIGTDSYEGGQKCAAALLRYVKPGDLVAIMSYVKGSSTAIDRESGVRDGLDGKGQDPRHLVQQRGREPGVYPGCPADRAYAGPPRDRGAERPDGAGGRPSAGASPARRHPSPSSGSTIPSWCSTMSSGASSRDTVVQKPFNMGYLGIQVARELIEHRRPPRFINTGSVDISRANMFQPENQRLLFPVAEGP